MSAVIAIIAVFAVFALIILGIILEAAFELITNCLAVIQMILVAAFLGILLVGGIIGLILAVLTNDIGSGIGGAVMVCVGSVLVLIIIVVLRDPHNK